MQYKDYELASRPYNVVIKTVSLRADLMGLMQYKDYELASRPYNVVIKTERLREDLMGLKIFFGGLCCIAQLVLTL